MDWDTYKELSHSPPYFTRWALDKTIDHVTGTLREYLAQCTSLEPLEKPSDHKGGPKTDILKLELTSECVQSIVAALDDARARLKLEEASSQTTLSTLIKSWVEYQEWLSDDTHHTE